jgi:hypothetical protein
MGDWGSGIGDQELGIRDQELGEGEIQRTNDR